MNTPSSLKFELPPIADRGLFVVLEGVDGSGSTTQGERLATAFRGRRQKVLFTHEPSGGPAGAMIRLALARRLRGQASEFHDEQLEQDQENDSLDARTMALLFAADRADHLATTIRPSLSQGRHVICDRYLLSTLAYQGTELDPVWLLDINRFAPRPDLTILLATPVEHARLRMRHTRWTRDIYETIEQQRVVESRYTQFANEFARDLGPIAVVDATRSVDHVHSAIWTLVEPLLPVGPRNARQPHLSLFAEEQE